MDRCAVSKAEGSQCQKEDVDFGVGSGHGEGSSGREGLVRDMVREFWEVAGIEIYLREKNGGGEMRSN